MQWLLIPAFSAKTVISAIVSIVVTIKTLPISFSVEALPGSSPLRSMTFLQILPDFSYKPCIDTNTITYTPVRYGRIRSTELAGPAGTHIKFPAFATLPSPNTSIVSLSILKLCLVSKPGIAMNSAPEFVIR